MNSVGNPLPQVPIKEVNEVKFSVTHLLLIAPQNILAVSSNSSQIKLFTLKGFRLVSILKGHKSAVTYISLLPNGNLISSSVDKTIRIWNINSSKQLHKITEHTNTVSKVIPISNNRICSSSWDKTIKIFDASYHLLATLQEHEDSVKNVLQLSNENLLSGGSDSSLIFWSSETYKKIRIMKEISYVTCNRIIEIDKRRICVGGVGSITVINYCTYQVESFFESENFDFVSCFCRGGDKLIWFGSSGGNIDLMNVDTFEVVQKIHDAHRNCVNSVAFFYPKKRLFSCGEDYFIKMWDAGKVFKNNFY